MPFCLKHAKSGLTRNHARPHQVILLADAADGQEFLAQHADFYQSIVAIDGKATAYVCEDFVCKLPTHDPGELRKLLTPEPPVRD